MLVLSRTRGQTVVIGDNIEVTIVDIRGDKVRVGITAPKDISVHRKEIYDEIRRENEASANLTPADISQKPTETPVAKTIVPPNSATKSD